MNKDPTASKLLGLKNNHEKKNIYLKAIFLKS